MSAFSTAVPEDISPVVQNRGHYDRAVLPVGLSDGLLARYPPEEMAKHPAAADHDPFWTNFLIRTYAWILILQDTGLINQFLLNLGIIGQPLKLFGTETAVIIGLVYGWFPDMVLPCYAALERLDFSLVEAAEDLYANEVRSFWRVIFHSACRVLSPARSWFSSHHWAPISPQTCWEAPSR